MTFLELCQNVGTDSGLISHQNKPTTVANPQGKWAEIVHFTANAWETIQRGRKTWEFLRGTFSHALVPGQASYLPAELGITERFARFGNDVSTSSVCVRPMRCFDPALGEADSQDICQISAECWSMVYGRGAQLQTRPGDYALANGRIYLGPIPDKTYTFVGEYWKAPQKLVADTDVPDMPEHFHDIIKWRGIMFVAGKDGAFTDRVVAQAEFGAMYAQLVNDQTRPVTFGAPLA